VDKLQQFEVLRTAFPFGYCGVGMLFFPSGKPHTAHLADIRWNVHGAGGRQLL